MEQMKLEDFPINNQIIVVGYGTQADEDKNSLQRRLKFARFNLDLDKNDNFNISISYKKNNYTRPCGGKYVPITTIVMIVLNGIQ